MSSQHCEKKTSAGRQVVVVVVVIVVGVVVVVVVMAKVAVSTLSNEFMRSRCHFCKYSPGVIDENMPRPGIEPGTFRSSV